MGGVPSLISTGKLNWSKAEGLRMRFRKTVSPVVRDASTFFFSTPVSRKRDKENEAMG